MTNDQDIPDIQRLAAEYVLGTLEYDERKSLDVRRQINPELNQAIIDWENKLAPLNDYIQTAKPRADLLNHILAKLDARDFHNGTSQPVMPSKNNIVELNTLKKRLNRWRMTAITASAIAAGLAVLMIGVPQPQHMDNTPFVAVFQADDKQPAFIMSIDINTRQLTVRPISAEGSAPGKTYQLWIKADEIGPKPRSLGLLTSIENPIQKQLEYDPNIIRHATFGISIEPEGGSPTGTPTGPAIHGTLYPTSI